MLTGVGATGLEGQGSKAARGRASTAINLGNEIDLFMQLGLAATHA